MTHEELDGMKVVEVNALAAAAVATAAVAVISAGVHIALRSYFKWSDKKKALAECAAWKAQIEKEEQEAHAKWAAEDAAQEETVAGLASKDAAAARRAWAAAAGVCDA